MRKTLARRKGKIVRREFQLTRAEDLQLADMARRADLSRSAFLRSMLATHAKIERELSAQKAAEAAALERRLVEAAQHDHPAGFVAVVNGKAA